MSNLSAIEYVTSPSALTTGLFNQRYSVISANFAALNSDVTINVGSGNTLSILTNLETSGGAHFQFISVGSTPPSYVTTAAITVAVNSSYSDYLYLTDSSAQKSSYAIGSRAGNLADGLNIWDASAATMIVTFSKQSTRFFQPIVGPVFDIGGDYYNAATFVGSGSSLSGIQAAIIQASTDVKSRVLVPASMYPYDASVISFIYTVQMVREGGRWDVYDVRAYGATGKGLVSDASALQSVISAAATRGPVLVSVGTYSINTSLRMPAGTEIIGEGRASIIVSSYTTGAYMLHNSIGTHTSIQTNYRLYNFVLDGGGTGVRGTQTGGRAGCVLFRYADNVEINSLFVRNSKEISIAYQGCKRVRIVGNEVTNSEVDGITGYWDVADVVVANNVVRGVGDDGIAVNGSSFDAPSQITQPTRVTIIGNTVFGQSAYTSPAVGRGIQVSGADSLDIVGNTVSDTFAAGIYLQYADNVSSVSLRCTNCLVVGNSVMRAGKAGTGAQSPSGIRIIGSDRIVVSGNVVSHSSANGISLEDVQFVTVTNNSVDSSGDSTVYAGIFATSASTCSFVVIAQNVIRNNAGAGVFIQRLQGGKVTGNVIIDNGLTGDGVTDYGSGIVIQGSGGQASNVVITDNFITDTKAVKKQSYGIRAISTSNATYLVANNVVGGNSGPGVNISGTPNTLLQYGNSSWEQGAGSGNWVGHWSPSAFTDGTALLPGLSFSSEVSLGLYRSGTSTMALSYGTLLLNSLLRVVSASGVLPQWRFLAGSGNEAQMGIGRNSQDFLLFAANSNGAFNTGTRVGDGGIQGNSTTTFHIAIGSATPQLSVTSLSGRGIINFRQSGLVSLRTVATSLDSLTMRGGEIAGCQIGSGMTLAWHSGSTIYFFTSSASTLG